MSESALLLPRESGDVHLRSDAFSCSVSEARSGAWRQRYFSDILVGSVSLPSVWYEQNISGNWSMSVRSNTPMAPYKKFMSTMNITEKCSAYDEHGYHPCGIRTLVKTISNPRFHASIPLHTLEKPKRNILDCNISL